LNPLVLEEALIAQNFDGGGDLLMWTGPEIENQPLFIKTVKKIILDSETRVARLNLNLSETRAPKGGIRNQRY
jgi:hypothetical protein